MLKASNGFKKQYPEEEYLYNSELPKQGWGEQPRAVRGKVRLPQNNGHIIPLWLVIFMNSVTVYVL